MNAKICRDRPDWADLEHFLELTRHGSQQSAARALGVTHTTVARRVAALEKSLGFRLFVRVGNDYELTEEGRRVVAHAAEMEASVASMLNASGSAAKAAQKIGGIVRISTVEAIAAFTLPEIAKSLHRRHPDLIVEVLSANRNYNLARRECDLAIRLGRPDSTDVVAFGLGSIDYGFFALRGSRYEKDPSAIEYIGYEAGDPFPVSRYFDRVIPGPRYAMRTNSTLVRLNAVLAGLGVALLPRIIAARFPELAQLPLAEETYVREAWLLCLRETKDAPHIRACIDRIQAEFHGDGIQPLAGTAAAAPPGPRMTERRTRGRTNG